MFDYESQLNTYAWLFRKNGFEVDELEVVFIIRDWDKRKSWKDPNYPQTEVVKIPIKLWSNAMTEGHVRGCIANFETYKEIPDNELPECTPADRWSKPSKWALMKVGGKRATKLYDELPENMQLEQGFYWEERKDELWKRCDYCSGKLFCNQWQTGQDEE